MPQQLPPASFLHKKQKILTQLSLPALEYDDLSPKGTVDTNIRTLIDEINEREGLVTTSSCGGRVSVFLEGVKKSRGEKGNWGEGGSKLAGVGGKGGGGRWLFVSHERVDGDVDVGGGEGDGSLAGFLGMEKGCGLVEEEGMDVERRLIHFKFEPMILHILTASLQHANLLLTAAHQSGFRESGALNLISTSSSTTSTPTTPPTPMVAIRTMGLSLESIIGSCSNEPDGTPICFVPEEYLRLLIETANIRFVENTKRIERFQRLLGELFDGDGDGRGRGKVRVRADGDVWEDKELRKERMRREGLRKREEYWLRIRNAADCGEEQRED